MTDHKFEPGQLVLVRNSDEHKWRLLHYSHFRNSADEHFFATIGERDYRQCIPFNDDTKYLQNTTLPYRQYKPPVEYEWGQKVEVYEDDLWHKALYLRKSDDLSDHLCSRKDQTLRIAYYPEENIRPLTDTAAHLDAKP